jgi:hypothetical protein
MDGSGTEPRQRAATWRVAGCLVALSVTLVACGGGGGGGGVGASSVAKFCTDANATIATIKSRVSNNIAPLGKSELTSLAAQLRKLAGEAPAQIKADLTTMGAFFDKASTNGIGAVDSATTSAESAAENRVSVWGDANCGSGNGNAGASAPTGATRSLTAFCADVGAVAGDAGVVHVTLQSGISASVFQQYVTAAQHLAAEAPPTPSNLAQDAQAIANDLSAILKSPNDPNAAPNFVPDTAGLSTDASTDCSGGVPSGDSGTGNSGNTGATLGNP